MAAVSTAGALVPADTIHSPTAMPMNGSLGMPGMRPISTAPPAAVRSVIGLAAELKTDLPAEVGLRRRSHG